MMVAVIILTALLSFQFVSAIERDCMGLALINPPSFFCAIFTNPSWRSAHARRGPSFCQYTSCTNFSLNLCAI